MELGKILSIIYRKKWLILALFLTIPSLVYFTTSNFIKDSYKATAKIWLEDTSAASSLFSALRLADLTTGFAGREEGGNLADTLLSGQGKNLRTLIQLMTTRPILEKVISRLQLKTAEGKPMDPELFRKKIEVAQLSKTQLIKVNGISHDPKEARDIANTLTQVFVEETKKYSQEKARAAKEFIQTQLPIVKEEWNKALEKLRQYQEREGTINLEIETRIALEKLAELFKEKEDNIIDLAEAQAKLRTLENQLKKQNEGFVSSSTLQNNPQIKKLKEELIQLDLKLSEALTEVTEFHPRVIAIQKQIEKTREELQKELGIHKKSAPELDRLQREISALNAHLAGVNADIEKYVSLFNTLPKRASDYARLRVALDTGQALYKTLLTYQYQVQIAEAISISRIRVVEPAIKPTRPFWPRPIRLTLIAAVLSLMLGLGTAFLIEHMDDTLRTPEEVKEEDTTLLGTIPKFRKREKALILDRLPMDPLAEAYRTIRNNLRFTSPDRPIKSLLITSAGVYEGKSLTVANLGISFSHEEIKVLIMDTDLRNPSQHKLFGIPEYPGITNIILGEIELENAIQKTPIEGLSILTAGSLPPNPGQLIESKKMSSLIQKARNLFDLIILDSPPALLVHDAAILSNYVDGTIDVLECGKITRRELSRTKEVLNKVGTNISGVIFNKYKLGIGDGYYRYYYPYSHYPTKSHLKLQKQSR